MRVKSRASLYNECCAGDRNAPVFPRERRAEESIAPRAGTVQIGPVRFGPVLLLSAVSPLEVSVPPEEEQKSITSLLEETSGAAVSPHALNARLTITARETRGVH